MLRDLTIGTAAERLRRGDLSSVDLTRAALARIAATDGAVHAFLTVTGDDALAMGSSNENSAFGGTRNPWDLARVPGARRAARPRRSRPVRRSPHSAPTPAARSACPPPTRASSA